MVTRVATRILNKPSPFGAKYDGIGASMINAALR